MKRHLFWIAEVFIWLLILFLISGVLIFAKMNYKKTFNIYQIFLPDVDGLISGSPVRLMGIQVGYVNQIDIVGEDVYVKFIITKRETKIPQGTIATVEFSGLGGSKSLELYPPDSKMKPGRKFIVAQSPKRIHDSFSLLNRMFEQIAEIAYTCSNFMDKVGIIKKKQQNSANENLDIDKILHSSNGWLDNAQKNEGKINAKIQKMKEGKGHGTSNGKN